MLWSSNAALASNQPKETLLPKLNVSNNVHVYQNTTPSSFRGANNMVVGTYGVTKEMVGIAHTNGKKNYKPGWFIVKSFMGPLNTVTLTANGTLFANGDILQVTSTVINTVNTSAVITTDVNGVISSLAPWSNNGGLFVNTSTTTLQYTSVHGTGVTGSFTLGGRAGRKIRECLVALPSMGDSVSLTNTPMYPTA